MSKTAPRPASRPQAWLTLSLVAILLTGCGGSSGDAGTTPSSGGQFSTGTGTTTDCGISNLSTQMLAALNAQRATARSCGTAGTYAATTALTSHSALTQAAAAHTQDMASHALFSHTGSDGSSVGARAIAAGYGSTYVGENIGLGYADISEVVAGWMASAGHCANIMDATYKEAGAACVQASDGTRYWTLVLGAR